MTEDTSAAVEIQEPITDALARGKLKRVRRILRDLSPAETAELLIQLDEEQRQVVWDQIGDLEEPDILVLLPAELAELLQANSDDNLFDGELEDDEDGCCPEYDPSGDGTGRCAYSCPECGICLRDYIGEEFE